MFINACFINPCFINPWFINPFFIKQCFINPWFINPCFINPWFISPCFINPYFTNPWFISPCFINPCFNNPCFINPCFINPWFINPWFINPCFINPRTYKGGGGGGGGGWLPPPSEDFLIFFSLDDKTSASEVFSSCLFNPLREFWDKFSDGQLVWLRDRTSYVAGGQAVFEWKCMFFQPCLVTSQASSRPTTHKIYLILLRRSKLSTKDKIVWKYCNSSKPQGRGSINPTLYNGGVRTLRVRPRVNPCFINLRFINPRLINCWPAYTTTDIDCTTTAQKIKFIWSTIL